MTKRMNTMNNLQLLLSTKFWTIKDLHAEVILIMCHTLIAEYLQDEKENKDKTNDVISIEEKELIYNTMEELHSYLSTKIFSYNRMEELLFNAYKSRQDNVKARYIEPYAYYYNVLINSFTSRLNFVTKENETKKYIPDLLVIELIKYYKENYYSSAFKRFDFIENIDLKSIAQIYINIQVKERTLYKQKTPIQEQTLIRKMRNVAHFMVDKMIETKYSKAMKK